MFQTAVPALTGRAVDIATGNAEGSVTRTAWLMVAVAAATAGHFNRSGQQGGAGHDRVLGGQLISACRQAEIEGEEAIHDEVGEFLAG